MIVGNYFKGDTNETLKQVQHDAYAELISYLFVYPKEHYLKAAKLIGIETVLAKKVKSVQSFDHRVLQMPHDILASWFRYKNYPDGQLLLFPDGNSYKSHLLGKWAAFFHNTVRELAETCNDFVISSLKAVCYENTALGYLAEDQLLDSIATYCSVGDWLSKSDVAAINEAVKQQISDYGKESETILTKAEVQLVVSDYIVNSLLKKESPIEDITDKQPYGISAYNLPQKDCWYVVYPTHEGITLLDGPKRLICVSKKNARIIYDEIVQSG
ncbi:MAG: hypothetical protein Q7J15_00055 [Candidatus Desulfaltia sp.]|nr:hypothetical protein [Candidatus Desulfaltia sp.]